MHRRAGKEYRATVHRLLRQGWRLEHGKRHLLLVPPRGPPVALPHDSTGSRTVKNVMAQIRRAERAGQ